jgi:DNA polymerase III sliding clamp (beta) subunit (PCNA family)
VTKIVASAGVLAKALALAASLNPPSKRPYAALEAVNVSTGADAVMLARNVLDFQISLQVSATIERPGSLAMPSGQLARLAAGFPAVAGITIEDDGSAARIRSGRSHYRLPVTPAKDLPQAFTVPTDAAGVELSRDQAQALFAPAFCAAQDARTYICGLHIHDSGAGLTAVATDG